MPRPSLLITVFVVSFLAFTVWKLPAELVVGHLGQVPLGQGRLQLSEPGGRLWDGRAQWRWQRYRGELDWRLDWRGLEPGLWLAVSEHRGPLKLRGWFAPLSSAVKVKDLEIRVPVALVSEAIPQGSADGEVAGRLETLVWTGSEFDSLSGTLRYGGGQVRWGRNGSATIPALDGRLFMENSEARGVITGPEEQRLAEASLADGEITFRVFRAWPVLLGESSGGAPEDVVFEVSRPVPGRGGE